MIRARRSAQDSTSGFLCGDFARRLCGFGPIGRFLFFFGGSFLLCGSFLLSRSLLLCGDFLLGCVVVSRIVVIVAAARGCDHRKN